MLSLLPVTNGTLPRELFEGMIFLPIAFSLLVWISLLVTIVVIRCTYFCYRRQIIIVRKNSKTYGFMLSCYDKLEKLNVLIFPSLFSAKKMQSGTKEWKEVLFLNKRWPEYQGSKNPKTELIVLFASLGISTICISALGFFRNFPVITGSECLERDNHFNTWYCYDNSGSEPLDCEEYVSTSESSSTLRCYAFSLDIGTSSAVAFGLYNLFTLVIFGIVFLRKYFYWMCQKCKMPLACGVYCYSITISSFWLITALCLLIYMVFNGDDFLGTEEYVYRIVLDSIPFVFAVYALIIPLLMHRYGVDAWPTYSCLATVDEEAEVELTPCIANDRDNSQYTAFEDMIL